MRVASASRAYCSLKASLWRRNTGSHGSTAKTLVPRASVSSRRRDVHKPSHAPSSTTTFGARSDRSLRRTRSLPRCTHPCMYRGTLGHSSGHSRSRAARSRQVFTPFLLGSASSIKLSLTKIGIPVQHQRHHDCNQISTEHGTGRVLSVTPAVWGDLTVPKPLTPHTHTETTQVHRRGLQL